VTVRLTIGSNVAYVNDRPVTLDVPARIVRGRTLVPLRFVSEALGAQVAWDAAARLVSVVTGAGAAPAKEAEKPTEEVAEKPTTTPTTGGGGGGGGGGAAPAAQEKVLWLGAVTSFDPFNPLVNSELRRINYSGFTHVGLVKFDANNNIVPCLAERWEVLDGGKTIRFHLVRNVKWHDGQPVTARDVKFNYEYKIRHGVGGDTYYFRRYLDSIQVEDDHTVTIRFKQSAVRPILIEMAMAYVIPEHVWSKVDNPKGYTGQDAWVGCGPFVFESYDRAASTAYFKRNDEYFAGRPYVTRIAYKNYATYDALVMALKKGEIDATFGGYAKPVPASYAPALVDTENVRLGVTEYLGTLMTLVFNVKTELFKEKQFREAVAYAIDYDKLRQMFAMGYGQIPGRGFTPPCVPGFDATIPKLEYNKERAQSLLDSLGWVDTDNDGWRNLPGKGNIAFSITPEAFAGKEYLIDAIAVICEMLKEVGIYACLDREVVGNEDKIDARIFSDKDYWAYVGYCTPLGVLADGGAVYLAAPNPQTGTPGDGTCDDPEYLAARDRALFAPTLDEAARALKEVQEYQARELPGLALIWGKVLYPYRTDRFTGWVMQEGWGPVNYNTWFSLKPL
ncbi:MAG: ABC transporter substrate-binding protein, partial [Desulfotomaculales bacterium]